MYAPLPLPHRLTIALCALFFFCFGVLSLAWPADGDDLLIFHAAGEAARQGFNPYTPGRFSDPFSYPPAWVPFCVVLSWLPALAAVWVWKFLNVLFLIGTVHLSLKLVFREYAPSPLQRTAAWCYALLLWPTSIAVFDGNTPLCVLFFVLLGLWLSERGRPYLAGVCFGFSLIKPNVVLPLFALLLIQGKWRLLTAALLISLGLTAWGVHLTGIELRDYLAALQSYNAANSVTDNSSVGLAKLIALLSGFDSAHSRVLAVAVGVLVIISLAVLRYRTGWLARVREPDRAWSMFFLLGIGFLGARGYDLVFVIPVFVWLISLKHEPRFVVWPALFLALALAVPQRAVEILYERVFVVIFPSPVFNLLLSPFRSWVVVALILLLSFIYWHSASDRASSLA